MAAMAAHMQAQMQAQFQAQARMAQMYGYGWPGGAGGFPGYPSPYPQADGYAPWAMGFGDARGGGAKGSGTMGRVKGKGKGKSQGFKGSLDFESELDALDPGDPRRQIELAQRKAKQRNRSAITMAQRSAQQRFEQELLERLQGSWIDAADASTVYVVEGSLCCVSGGENARTFRNRLSAYNGELCWDARRFWHKLDISSIPPADEEVQTVEWVPGEGSPPANKIRWVRAPMQSLLSMAAFEGEAHEQDISDTIEREFAQEFS